MRKRYLSFGSSIAPGSKGFISTTAPFVFFLRSAHICSYKRFVSSKSWLASSDVMLPKDRFVWMLFIISWRILSCNCENFSGLKFVLEAVLPGYCVSIKQKKPINQIDNGSVGQAEDAFKDSVIDLFWRISFSFDKNSSFSYVSLK